MKSAAFALLKSKWSTHTEYECLSFACFPRGFAKGAITEISGSGKTELVLAFISEYPELKVAWVEEDFSIYPFGFIQRHVDLGRILFVDAQKNAVWCCLQILKSQIFPVLVLYANDFDLQQLRKIQLASERSQTVTIWLTSKPKSLWPVSLQLTVERREAGLAVQTIKQKYSDA